MPIVKYCIVSIACLLVSMNVNATQSSDLPYPVEVFQTYCVSSDGDHRQIVNMAKAMEFDEITGEALNATINPDTEGKAYVVERKPAERQMITLGTTTINTCSVYTQGYATMENLSYIGFYPVTADIPKKRHTVPKECSCPDAENIAQSSNAKPSP